MSKYSLQQLETIASINRQIERLERTAGALQTALRQCQLVQASVAVIPRPAAGDEGNRPAVIVPEQQNGPKAFELALKALTDWYGDPEFSTKAVARYPGAVALECDNAHAARILKLARIGNTIKDRIRALYPKLGNKSQAFELLHNYHHMLVYLQLVRHWTALPRDPLVQSVTFTWGFKPEIRKLSAADAVKNISEWRAAPPPEGMEASEWQEIIDNNLLQLQSLPGDTPLQHRRHLVVRPLANVRYALTEEEREVRRAAWQTNKPAKEKVKTMEGHTPILLINPDPKIKIKPIGQYDELKRLQRKKRAGRKAKNDPLLGFSTLYEVVTE